jgi:hypothetical protein
MFRHVGSDHSLVSPLGTAATDWPIVACPGWLGFLRFWWIEDWQGKPKYSEKKTRHSATLSTKKPTWPDPGSNPGRRCGKPATIRIVFISRMLIRFNTEKTPLQRPADYSCFGKKSLFVEETIWNTQTHSEGRLKRFIMLKPIETLVNYNVKHRFMANINGQR